MRQQILNLFTTPRDMSWEDILLNIVLAAVLGFFIFLSYAISHRGTIYSRKFNASLVILAVLTGTVMTVIGNNIALSLGMVGALSIVRFRTAIKDPMDLMFLFWSISVGIICGAGLAQVAVILSVVVTLGILILDKLPVAKAPMILIVNAGQYDAEAAVVQTVQKYTKSYTVKSRNLTESSLDLVLELRTDKGGELVREIMALQDVTSASLMSHDGEVTF